LHPLRAVHGGSCGTGDMARPGAARTWKSRYLETAMRSELQGNVADLCPVGALLPKPIPSGASWNSSRPSFDVMDALGSAIRIDTAARGDADPARLNDA